MNRYHIHIGETIATALVNDEYLGIIKDEIYKRRGDIIEYIRNHPEFLTSLEPLPIVKNAPDIVKSMLKAAIIANVGPMASIAGAISYFVVKRCLDVGCRHIVFDNGGDIAMYIEKPIVVGIYAGQTGINGLGFHIVPRNQIFGICTSSGTVGPSLSLGISDATIVIADNPILADAKATAIGNKIQSNNKKELEKVIKNIDKDEIEGIMIIIDDKIGYTGLLPELIEVNVDYNLITKV